MLHLGLLAEMKHHLITRIVFGNMFSPEVPFAVLAFVGWALCAGVLLLVLNALADTALFVVRLRGRRPTSGQIAIIRAVTPAATNDGYVSGRYVVAGMQLYVSNGTGIGGGFPTRPGVPAEITYFVLRARTIT